MGAKEGRPVHGDTGFNHANGEPDGTGPDGDAGGRESGGVGGVIGEDEVGENGGTKNGVVGILSVVVVEGRIVGGLITSAGREEVSIVVDEGVEGGADCFEGFFEAGVRVDEGEPRNIKEGVPAGEEGTKGGVGVAEHRKVKVKILSDDGVSVAQPKMEVVEVLGVPWFENHCFVGGERSNGRGTPRARR